MDDEESLTRRIIELASEYGRYGYRRITALLRAEGWHVNHKRVERIWRMEGLKVPVRQPKRGRLWLNDGSCVRHQPEYRNHVWTYEFVHERTHDGRALRMLVVMDEYTRECLSQHYFLDLREANRTLENWRREYNNDRPHSSLEQIPPAQFRDEWIKNKI